VPIPLLRRGRGPHRAALSAALAVVLGVLSACGGDGGDPTEPPPAPPTGVRAVAGAGVTDTIDAQFTQALVVEVRRPDGTPARGAVVRFEARPPADSTRRNDFAVYVCPLSAQTCGISATGTGTTAQFSADTTDVEGRAKTIVRLGRVAGRAVVRVSVPELGFVDSVSYTVTAGAAARVRAAAADTGLDIGATATLRARVVDRYGNARSETPALSLGTGDAIALDAASAVVTARGMGTQWLYARLGTLADSTSVRVVPPGRLVVWAASSGQSLRLVNLNGTGTRTLVTGVSSDFGVFPRFDATRQRVTLHAGSESFGGSPNRIIVVDTSGTPRRDIGPAGIGPAGGLNGVIAVRQLSDGSVLAVARRPLEASYAVWRVAANDAITLVAPLPALSGGYGAADLSHDGTRLAYVATTPGFTQELRVLTLATGASTALETNGRSPRWSSQGDRVAYLVPAPNSGSIEGVLVTVAPDGTGRRALGSTILSPGLAWSPDGAYLLGRVAAFGTAALQLVRVSDGASVLVRFRTAAGGSEDYYQPDWR
jgi:hypothetical protein